LVSVLSSLSFLSYMNIKEEMLFKVGEKYSKHIFSREGLSGGSP
jgi:hypothetical protein